MLSTPNLAVSVVLAAVCPAVAQDDHQRPAVFQDLGFDAALEQSTTAGKLLILDAMTSWCGPCKIMDRTTWVDDDLVVWIREHAIAIQLDMDVHQDVKERLAIRAFPTIVVFRDGVEFDRFVGLRDAAFVGKWLSGASIGKSGLDQAIDQLTALSGNPDRAAERAELCARIADYGAYPVVTPELLSIWREGRAADGSPYRGRFLFPAIATVVRGSDDARAAFVRVRDALGERVRSAGVGADARDVSDWLELNVALDDPVATASWAKAMAAAEGGDRVLQSQEGRLFRLLIANGDWAAAGHCLRAPVAWAQELAGTVGAPAGEAAPRSGMMPAIPLAPRAGAEAKPEVVPAIPLAPRPAAVPVDAADGPQSAPPKAVDPDEPNWDNPSDPAAREREIRARVRYAFRQDCADRYAALLAAGRIDEASRLADIVLATIDTPRARAALVARALRAGQFDTRREAHVRWLEEAGG